jgi:hypothetical protein
MSGLCSANNIHVLGSGAHNSSETMCNTFAPKGIKNAITHLTNMNVRGEIQQIFTNDTIQMSPIVKCEAVNCTFNDDRVCHADNVQIFGPRAAESEGTQCETFRQR